MCMVQPLSSPPSSTKPRTLPPEPSLNSYYTHMYTVNGVTKSSQTQEGENAVTSSGEVLNTSPENILTTGFEKHN